MINRERYLLTERLCLAVDRYLFEIDNPAPDYTMRTLLRKEMRQTLIALAKDGKFITPSHVECHERMLTGR